MKSNIIFFFLKKKKGSLKWIHKKCLYQHLDFMIKSGKKTFICTICNEKYRVKWIYPSFLEYSFKSVIDLI